MILAGDVGGTKVRLALYEAREGRLLRRSTEEYPSRSFQNLAEPIRAFLASHPAPVDRACVGAPGPVVEGRVTAVNLPWDLRESDMAAALPGANISLVNDLVATTAAIPHFTPADLLVLHPGKPADVPASCAVLAPGTGLGQAFLYRDAATVQVLHSEGGHVDFAPTTDIEVELLQFLRRKYDHVSYERLLSGPGLVNIYEFLRETKGLAEPDALAEQLQAGDPAAVISAAALRGEFDICVRALDLFVSILGAQAGNMVLMLFATGGVYLGGGISPKIRSKLEDGTIVRSFLAKGRMAGFVEKTPIYLILDDHAALLGAASLAVQL